MPRKIDYTREIRTEMARDITRFADRTFFHTVELGLLERLLEQCGVGVASLPQDNTDRANSLFEIFFKADEASIDLHEALYSIMRLANHNGMSLLIDIAAEGGVHIESLTHSEASGNPLPATPKHLALKAYLDHREIFDNALDAMAFVLPRAPLEWQGLEENVRPLARNHRGRNEFCKALSKHFESRYRGDFCDVKWFDEPDGLATSLLLMEGICRRS